MREMKDSGIEWIGATPETWKMIPLKYLASYNDEVLSENTDDEFEFDYIEIGSVQYGRGIIYTEHMKFKNAPSRARRIVRKDDIIVSTVRTYLKAVATIPACNNSLIASTGFIVIRPHKVLPRFMNYALLSESFISLVESHSTGISYPAINSVDVVKFKIPVPCRSEQERIAAFLDAECAEIDTVLEKTRASIEEYKKLKQAVITQAVTKGIRGDRPMKDSGIEWIGDIPAEWTASKIKYCTEFAPSCNTSHLSEDSLVTFTPMECIKNGYFENREAHFSALSSSYTQYQDGDIVFAKVTPCFENGNIAIMQGLSAGVGFGSSELFVIRPQSINTEFIFYYLQNDIFKQYACATMTGTGGLKRVSPTFVRNYSVFIPCNEEQLEIVRYLNEKCSGIEVLIAKKQQYLTEIENYKKSLIYEYVTGKKEVV